MIVKRLFDEKLSQTAYLVGCPATGEALVVDANRKVDALLQAAERERLRITHVTETHIHADFVSGSRELAARTGARLYLSAEGGPDWTYAFAEDAGAVLLKDGDSFMVGNVRVEALHTPGHTPEHLTFLVTDTAAADRPIAALTGDFVFVGDVGRPDLLERAAGQAGTMVAGARALFRSLQRFRAQPDWLQIWPGHGAGSACGKGLSAIPHSTLGYEKLYNWAFAVEDEEEFVRQVLEGQPEPPRYFAEMKRINRGQAGTGGASIAPEGVGLACTGKARRPGGALAREGRDGPGGALAREGRDGPPLLHGFRRPERLPGGELRRVLDDGAVVADLRPAQAYAAAFVPGTINIPLNRAFATWAGWLLPYGRDFYLLLDGEAAGSALEEALEALALIGLDRVAGWFGADALAAWADAAGELAAVPQLGRDDVARHIEKGDAALLDVRGRAEYEAGRIPGAQHIFVGYLAEAAGRVPRDRPVVLYCESGSRSAIAASLLWAAGLRNVACYPGGIVDWQRAGQATERGPAAASPAAP